MKKNSLIRTIYLYLFAMIGLILIVTATVDFIDMGLKAYIFTQAEEEDRLYEKMPPMAPRKIANIASEDKTTIDGKLELTEEQTEEIQTWLVEYKQWKERNEKFDRITSRRHRDASHNLAMLFVGIPLYLYHWAVIKKETKSILG